MLSLSLRAARKHHTRWFFENHSRGNRRIVLRNQPEYRRAYAFNRIVNPFLSSVRAEQLENCMQMQKYSGESARVPWFLIDSRRNAFSLLLFLLSCSFVVHTLFHFPTLLSVFDYLFFLSCCFYWLLRNVIRRGHETKFWSCYSLCSFLWFRNRVPRDLCVYVNDVWKYRSDADVGQTSLSSVGNFSSSWLIEIQCAKVVYRFILVYEISFVCIDDQLRNAVRENVKALKAFKLNKRHCI